MKRERPTSYFQSPLRGIGNILKIFSPNVVLSRSTMIGLVLFQVVAFILVWANSPFEVLPKPFDVFNALIDLFTKQGIGAEILTSLELNVQALFYASILSMGLAYLTVMPFFRPVIIALSKGRFLSLVGFSFVFTLMLGGGGVLKLSLLIFGMTVFFLTSMAAVVVDIPKSKFDHARTLRMNEWQVVWEVVVLGTFDQALEVMRQNAAIGWMMLTMVEGIVRSEGGVGAMLLNQQKHFAIDHVFAIQLTILLIGLGQDYIIGFARRLLCPYAYLSLERK